MKVTQLPYMGQRRELVLAEEHAEVLFAPGSAMGLIVDNTTESEGADPLEVLEKFEEWLIETHGMTMIQATAAFVRNRISN